MNNKPPNNQICVQAVLPAFACTFPLLRSSFAVLRVAHRTAQSARLLLSWVWGGSLAQHWSFASLCIWAFLTIVACTFPLLRSSFTVLTARRIAQSTWSFLSWMWGGALAPHASCASSSFASFTSSRPIVSCLIAVPHSSSSLPGVPPFQ
eukprot:6201522-Pleurochrysis_carterae.AAC.2